MAFLSKLFGKKDKDNDKNEEVEEIVLDDSNFEDEEALTDAEIEAAEKFEEENREKYENSTSLDVDGEFIDYESLIPDDDEYDEDELQPGTAKAGELSFMEWNGAEYCGNVSKVNERSGFGVCKKVNGSYYAGEWKLDLQAGVGIEVTHEKEKYAGEWSLNRRNGVGTMVRTDGIRYSGEWKNGKMHGVGVLYYPNGERLCARFASGRIEQGSGVYYLQDGSYILGAMTENGPDGKCLHYKKDGSCETEQWLSGVKQ